VSGNKLGDKNIVILLEGLMDNENLKILDIGFNLIT